MCSIEQTRDRSLDKVGSIVEERDLKKPSLLRCVRRDLRPTPPALRSSNFHWMTAPQLPQTPDQASRPDRTDSAALPAAPSKDDIVGWPDEILIDFSDFPDCILDSAANSPTPANPVDTVLPFIGCFF
jgi:hypothetical protein